MTIRYVACTGKDSDGDITTLGNSGQPWSPRLKADAIKDIGSGKYEYRVTGSETVIHVVADSRGKYLRTNRDNTTRNNLDDLPDC